MPRFGSPTVFTGEQDAPELLSIPLSDSLSATASEAFSSSPTPASFRADKVSYARDNAYRAYNPMGGGGGYVPDATLKSTRTPLTREQVQAKIDAAGLTDLLKPTDGDTEESVSLLIDYKTRELRNQFILDRYRGGVGGGAAQLATGIAVSLADPVNIGSAFFPVVGQARYAQILGRAGTSMTSRALARTGVGALEGAVGAAAVEPIVYQSKQAIQADYDSYDSMANIGFGALFGGVLQPAAGAVGDVFARRARVGAWAENVTPAGERIVSDLPEGWIQGGGTRFIDGDDYVRGSYAVVDAASLNRPEAESFAQLDPSQVFESPYSDSGAPVFRPDGTQATGRRRLGAVLDTYASGNGDAYRSELVSNAERYGLDSEAVEGMAQPVLVRTESSREAGKWAQDRAYYENTPQARATFANPDEVVRGQFRRRARELGVSEDAADALAPSAARDSVTGFYDGRTDDAKASLLERAQQHVTETGDSAVFVSGDIFNLGGLNAHVGNRAEVANVHFRAMANLMREELDAIGVDVVPMRTGGDELGAVVIGASRDQVEAALDQARSRIAEYAELNDLAEIPHPKRSTDKGVGMHFGAATIDPRLSITEIANAADGGVDLSKQGIRNVRTSANEATGAGASGQRPGGAATGATGEAGAVRPAPEGRARAADRNPGDWFESEGGIVKFTESAREKIAAREPADVDGELRDGTEVTFQFRPDPKGAFGRFNSIEIYRKSDGYGIAMVNYGDSENPFAVKGSERAGPLVMVDEGFRRQGIATLLYGAAREVGALFPSVDATNADRTDLGQAMREGMARKGIRPEAPLSEVQHKAALQTGIAQAVNGGQVDARPAAMIDGTRAGAERFLEAQRIADESVSAYRSKTDAQNRKAVTDLAKFDPAEAEALDAEVKALEMSLRNEIKATGGDESLIDAALAEVDQLAEELDVESKALRGTALCMLRGG